MSSLYEVTHKPMVVTADAMRRLEGAGLAGLVCTYGVDAWDAQGRHLAHREDVSRSLLRNFSRMLRTFILNPAAGTLKFTDATNVLRNFNQFSGTDPIGGTALAGIGTGSTAVTPADYNYAVFVAEIAVGETLVDEPAAGAQTWRNYGNLTLASATAVTEIGLRQLWKVSTTGYSTMFARDVIAAVSVPAGGTIQVRYDWTVTP